MTYIENTLKNIEDTSEDTLVTYITRKSNEAKGAVVLPLSQPYALNKAPFNDRIGMVRCQVPVRGFEKGRGKLPHAVPIITLIRNLLRIMVLQ